MAFWVCQDMGFLSSVSVSLKVAVTCHTKLVIQVSHLYAWPFKNRALGLHILGLSRADAQVTTGQWPHCSVVACRNDEPDICRSRYSKEEVAWKGDASLRPREAMQLTGVGCSQCMDDFFGQERLGELSMHLCHERQTRNMSRRFAHAQMRRSLGRLENARTSLEHAVFPLPS